MATLRRNNAPRRWVLTPILILSCVGGGSSRAAQPDQSNAAKRRETVSSLKELHAAVQAQHKSSAEAAPTLPKRPARTVTPPTLTPADLDSLMEQHLAKSKVPLAAPTTDVEFVRRVYLDLTGKLPTPEQVRAFCTLRDKEKRPKLLEHLLNSREYAANWANYWRDVIKFHATNPNQNQVRYPDFEEWLTDQFAKNRPWDEIARAMIVAAGRTDEPNGTAFHVAHEGQAVEMAGEVSRVFLGVQIQCAQCHDHPTDSWKRQQFHEFAAFFAGERVRRVQAPMPAQGQQAVFELVAQGKPRYTMPDLKDPQKQIFVAPRFFLGSAEPLGPGFTADQRRDVAAWYVTSQDNPWFARAFVNRIWYVLMGEGFYSPVDDLGPDRTAQAGEVLDALASQWQKGGYDIRWLFRTIMNTRTYQREIRSTRSASGKVAFASNAPARLRSDQILDSLIQALNLPIDGQGPAPNGNDKNPGKGQAKKAALAKDLKGSAAAAKGQGMRRPGAGRALFNTLYGIDPSTPNDDILGTIPQALFLMNSPTVNNAIKANPRTVLGQILSSTPDNALALRLVYLRVLAREPTKKEYQVCGRYLDEVGNRVEAFEDILWSLVNSTEFITRR
jgi:hypothetical protein